MEARTDNSGAAASADSSKNGHAPDNVKPIKPVPNPAYAVREPSIRDAVSLAGILAEGADSPQVFDAIGEGESQAAMLFLFTGALKNPRSRDGLLYLLADLWTYETPPDEVEIPPDEWEYEPISDKAPSREQNWKSISRKNRKRMIKRFAVEELPFGALMDFGRNIAALDSVKDFLDTVSSLVADTSGESTTDSRSATDGLTNG